MLLTNKDKESLKHRQKYKHLLWCDYYKQFHDTQIVTVRNKVIKFLKTNIQKLGYTTCKTNKNKICNLNPTVYFLYNLYQDVPYNCPFIYDVGSKNITSNVDLTIMNNSTSKIIYNLINLLNKSVNYYFTKQSLSNLLDLTFYISSFLFIKNGCAVLMNCTNYQIETCQRYHAKYRLQNPNNKMNPYSQSNSVDKIFRLRKKAIKEDDLQALNYTSILTYFSLDSYHSKGAFCHVLLEIQEGKIINNNIHEYLDSVFDNFGLMNSIPKCECNSNRLMKYLSRITHGLKRIKDLNMNFYNPVKEIVDFIDLSTVYDSSKPKMYFSIGSLSTVNCKSNTIRYAFNNIFHSQYNFFYIPGRKLQDNIDLDEFKNVLINKITLLEINYGI